MIFRKLWPMCKGQNGFTLIEVIVALAITGIIGLGATTATVQLFTQGSRNSDYTAASRNVMNVIYWVGRDAQMSQNLVPGGASGFPLTLSWTEWDNSEHQVIYSIEDDKLMRSYAIDGGTPTEIMVAQYINSVADNTTCDYDPVDRVLTVKVTATVGEGTDEFNVTKRREIMSRTGL